MNGDELITIIVEDPHTGKKLSSRYSILLADNYNSSKGDYHLMVLDALVERFDREKK